MRIRGRPDEASRSPLRDRTYRRLFTAQVVALLGTGLTTVALSLLAYDLAERDAGAVLGVALALKMVAYVVAAPLAAATLERFDRRRLLIALDLVRAAVVVSLPFVSAVWQVYVLIVVLSAASASFTPTFQAVIPHVLPQEERYTKALSLSRVAYELENLLSPALAALALLVLSYDALFVANAVGFLASAALVISVVLPAGTGPRGGRAAPRALGRVLQGVRRYFEVPQLRALFALDVAVAAGSAMVIVNTVVLVRDAFGQAAGSAVPVALGAAGAGAMIGAFAVPRLLRGRSERRVMLGGAITIAAALAVLPLVPSYGVLLGLWLALGLGLALIETPTGRLVHRASRDGEGRALFAAQFSLSHACWLVAYPVAGVLGARIGVDAVSVVLAVPAALGAGFAWLLWPTGRSSGLARPGEAAT